MAKSNRRRVKGTGTYREKRKGVFELKIGNGRRADGSPRYIYETVKGTKLDAERRLIDLSRKLEEDKIIGSKYTIGQFYERKFLPYLDEIGAAQITRNSYKTVWTKIVKVGWDKRELSKLPSAAEVQSWVNGMTRGAGEQALKCFKSIINYAYRCDYLSKPPYHGRTFTRTKRDESTAYVIWNKEQLATAIIKMKHHRLYGYLLVAAGCGCRKEEAQDLICDKDFEIVHDAGETVIWVKIDSAFTAADGEKDVKTPQSNRTVPITGHIAELLEEYLDGRTGYLIKNLKGQRLGVTGLRKTWDTLFRGQIERKVGCSAKPAAPLHGLPRITPNKLRHIHTTICGNLMIGDTLIAQYHGHLAPTTQGKYYRRHYTEDHSEAFLNLARVVAAEMDDAFVAAYDHLSTTYRGDSGVQNNANETKNQHIKNINRR